MDLRYVTVHYVTFSYLTLRWVKLHDVTLGLLCYVMLYSLVVTVSITWQEFVAIKKSPLILMIIIITMSYKCSGCAWIRKVWIAHFSAVFGIVTRNFTSTRLLGNRFFFFMKYNFKRNMLTRKKISTRASKVVVWLSTNQKIKAR